MAGCPLRATTAMPSTLMRLTFTASDSGSSTSSATSSVPAASSLSRLRRLARTLETSTPGDSRASDFISGGITVDSMKSRSPTTKRFFALAGSKLCVSLSSEPIDCNEPRSGSISRLASGVGTIRWPWRSKSGSLNRSRSRASAWLMAGWVRCSFSAALVMPPSV
ncbi:hypothetical protein D9M68_785930 [compost metagenome]